MPITFANAPNLAGSIVSKTMNKIAPVKTANTSTGIGLNANNNSYNSQTNARMGGVLSGTYSLPTQQLAGQLSLNNAAQGSLSLSTAINTYLGGSISTGSSFNTLAR